MSDSPLTALTLLAETRRITISQVFTAPGTLQINWTFPTFTAVDGILVAISTTPFNSSMSPVNEQRYLSGTDLSTFTGNMLGTAYVVYTGSKINGDTLAQTITVTNVDPTESWYVLIFGISNTFHYSSSPAFGYTLDTGMGNVIPTTFTGSIPNEMNPPANPFVGQVYYNLNTGKVQLWTGTIWIDASQNTVPTGKTDEFPLTPLQGDFFFNITTRVLYAFDGVNWNKANTAFEDVPMYDKVGIGTDGTSDERAKLIDVLKIQLGSPTVCIEVGEEAFMVGIDNALDEFRRRADNAYTNGYVILELQPGQTKYYLNDPRLGSNKIVNILKISRVNLMGLGSITGDASVYAQFFYNQLYQAGSFDILSIHMMASLAEEHQRIFAGDLAFVWDENTRMLHTLRAIGKKEKVVLECALERTEQELLNDRWAKQWIQHWAHSEVLEQLGTIRSKYGSLPGAGGGITLNGSELLALSAEMQTEALRQITDFEVGNGGVNFGNCAFLVG